MEDVLYKINRANEIIEFYKKLFNDKDKYIKYCQDRCLNPDAEESKKEWKEVLLSWTKYEIERI